MIQQRVIRIAVLVLAAVGFCSTQACSALAQDQATMAGFMQQLQPAYVADVANEENELIDILLERFEGDWTKAKECLLFERWPVDISPPPHEASLQLMEALVRMRSRVCGEIASETQAAILARVDSFPLEGKNPIVNEGMASAFYQQRGIRDPKAHFNPLAPTGAEKKTSDIDVASNGLNSELGVELFNTTFRDLLQVQWDPATVFDYNVYAADWIFPARFDVLENGSYSEITPRPEHILALDADASVADDNRLQADRARILDDAGLLHIRRNCTDAEWSNYLRLRSGSDPRIATQLQVVDAQFKAFQAEIEQMKLDFRQVLSVPQSAWPNSARYFDEALETRARNSIYESRLLRVKALRLHYQVLKEQPSKSDQDREQMFTLAKQVTEALAEALYFANEVYATEGATLHATQAIQKVAKAQRQGKSLRVNLTDAQYMQAFNENVGDSLHSLTHYADDPAYAAYRAGKYIDRFLLAADTLTGYSASADAAVRQHEKYDTLRQLASNAVEVKDSADGDDPVKIGQKDEFRFANLPQLREAILALGAFVPGVVKAPASNANSTVSVKVVFANNDREPITVYWVDYAGILNEGITVDPGTATSGIAGDGHVYVFKKRGRQFQIATLTVEPEQLFNINSAR